MAQMFIVQKILTIEQETNFLHYSYFLAGLPIFFYIPLFPSRKKKNLNDPVNLRRLSRACNLISQFHKILVKKITPLADISEFQLGFRPMDGMARGICLMKFFVQPRLTFNWLQLLVLILKKLSIAFFNLEMPGRVWSTR